MQKENKINMYSNKMKIEMQKKGKKYNPIVKFIYKLYILFYNCYKYLIYLFMKFVHVEIKIFINICI